MKVGATLGADNAVQEDSMANKPTPNDKRGVVKNPNNLQHDQAEGNRGKQLNPNQGGAVKKK